MILSLQFVVQMGKIQNKSLVSKTINLGSFPPSLELRNILQKLMV
ncbi:MAG: hypothetical protein ACJAZX_001400 [Rickettsiales bacterium]|jgi:hypothetical protein